MNNNEMNTVNKAKEVEMIQSGNFVTESQLLNNGWKAISRVGKHQVWKKDKRKLTWNQSFGQCTFIN